MRKSKAGALGPLVMAAACALAAAGGDTAFGQEPRDHSFRAPRKWSGVFPPEGPLDDDPPLLLADVNADGRKDLVHFGRAGVTVGFSTGASFQQAFMLAQYGHQQGWNQLDHLRTMGDLNNDGRADIVGFGQDGVYISLSTFTGFTPPVRAVHNFGTDQGWRPALHTRILADVDDDGRQDIVAFGEDGVWLSRSTAAGFTTPVFVLAEFGRQQGWNPHTHLRTAADVNGDLRADIVAMGTDGVWIALSTGTGFSAPRFVLADFGTESGWFGQQHQRVLVDVDRDGKDDIVGFGDTATWMARSNGAGFDPVTQASPHFGNSWIQSSVMRTATDVNNDGYPDLLLAANDSIFRILGGPQGFGNPRMVLRDLVRDTGFDAFLMVRRLIGDVDADGLVDLVGVARLSAGDVRVALSSNAPPPPPPANPTGARVVAKTHREVKIAWNDNSTDEISFIVHFGRLGNPSRPDRGPANVANRVIRDLDPDADHCFTVQAESIFSLSPPSTRVCTRTNPGTMPGPSLDRGLVFLCGAPAACPAGFHVADFHSLVGLCPGPGMEDNRTVCAADVGTFTACGSCPAGFDTLGTRFFEFSCALPNTPALNASRCTKLVVGP